MALIAVFVLLAGVLLATAGGFLLAGPWALVVGGAVVAALGLFVLPVENRP